MVGSWLSFALLAMYTVQRMMEQHAILEAPLSHLPQRITRFPHFRVRCVGADDANHENPALGEPEIA